MNAIATPGIGHNGGPKIALTVHVPVHPSHPSPELVQAHAHLRRVANRAGGDAVVQRIAHGAVDAIDRVRGDPHLHVRMWTIYWLRPTVGAGGKDKVPMRLCVQFEGQAARDRIQAMLLEQGFEVRLPRRSPPGPAAAGPDRLGHSQLLAGPHDRVAAVARHLPQGVAPLIPIAGRPNHRQPTRTKASEIARRKLTCLGVSHACNL